VLTRIFKESITLKTASFLLLFLLFSTSNFAQRKKIIGEYSDGLAWVKQHGKYGFQNEKGEVVIPLKYDSVFSFTEGVAAVKIDTNWFYIGKKGVAAEYQYGANKEGDSSIIYYKMARPYYHGLAVARYHGEWNDIRLAGFTDIFGDFSCDSLGDFKPGYAEIVHGQKHGIVDTLGDYLVPAIYEDVDSFSNGWVKAKMNGKWMRLNPYGRCIHCNLPPIKFISSFDTLILPNVVTESLFDEITKFKLSSLISFMERHPKKRMVIMGYGNDSYVTQQRSWDYVYAIIEYVLKQSNIIRREQFIFQYGRIGKYRTVSIRQAKKEENGPHNTPPPFPFFSITLK